MRHLLAAAALGLMLLPGTAAAGDAGLAVSQVRVDADVHSIELRIDATSLPDDAGLDAGSVQARVGDRALPVSAVVADSTTTTSAPRVLLVVDTSGSMQGAPLAHAKQAVSSFLADSPAEAEIGLLQLSSAPRLIVPPTRDRSRLLGAVTELQAQGETALYDAVLDGLRALGGSGDRRLVLLSDGGDTRSRSSLDNALRQVAQSGVTLDAVGFNTDEAVTAVLGRLSARGHGRTHQAASAAELSSALATTVRKHARALAVTVLVPEDLRGAQDLVLSVAAPTGRLSANTPVMLGQARRPVVATTRWWGSRDALLSGLAALGGGLLLGSLVLLDNRRRDHKRVHTVLERYTTAPAPVAEDIRTASPVVRTALGVANRFVTKGDVQDRLALRLDRAAIRLTPAEWILMRAGLAFTTILLLVLAGKHLLLAAAVGAVLATAVPRYLLRFRGQRRQKAFDEKLPDALQMVAGSLSAGYSLAQAMDGLVREGSEPMAGEIGRALAESRLGVAIEDTLDGVADRMDSRDFRWIVMAIRVQREVGGNLAGVLTTVSATMRERAMLRRHVRGLSAEGRLSAYILIGLPVFLALYMLTLRRDYIQPLYTTVLGVGLIALAVVLLVIGSFWMSRMVKVEV